MRGIALLSAGVVAAGVLGALPTATAAPDRGERAAATKQAPPQELGAGRYVVLLREPGPRATTVA